MVKRMTPALKGTLLALPALLVFAFTMAGNRTFALEDKSGPGWEQLRPEERRTLDTFAGQWADLSPEKRQRLRRSARYWLQMNESERVKARTRLEQWELFGPVQQQDIRERFRRFKQLPPHERTLLLESRQWFMTQSEPRRQQWRDRWDRLSAEEREEFLDRLKERWAEGQ